MIRDLNVLTGDNFDVLIVGGGIYGAAAAREAALRGLNTAIIEQHDFCAATSANSLKIIHGGLRYLQQADIIRVRESVLQRRNMLRIAPHLIHPLSCIMPTKGYLMKSKGVMICGLLANDILSCDRNAGLDKAKRITGGRVVGRSRCLEILPGLDAGGVSGGAMWHDAFAHNSERIVIDLIRSATEIGATAANYVKLTGFLCSNGRVHGVSAKDLRTGKEIEIRADLTINNTGPWTNEVLGLLDKEPTRPIAGLALGMNLVLKRQIITDHAAGLQASGPTGDRLMFFMPWRERTVAGTYYRSHEGSPDRINVTDKDIQLLLDDLNSAYPAAKLTRDDIALIHAGLLPTKTSTHEERDPKLLNHYKLVDHKVQDQIDGLVSVVGVKYTTACNVARRTIDIAAQKLNRQSAMGSWIYPPLPGGDIEDYSSWLEEGRKKGIPDHISYNYGTRRDSVRALKGGETAYATQEEMAQTLADTVFRRTDIGGAGLPGDSTLEEAGKIMAEELGWSKEQLDKELSTVKSVRFPGSELCGSDSA